MADEVTDASNHDQLVLTRYVLTRQTKYLSHKKT